MPTMSSRFSPITGIRLNPLRSASASAWRTVSISRSPGSAATGGEGNIAKIRNSAMVCLARDLGNPRMGRAIGAAVRANPVSIMVGRSGLSERSFKRRFSAATGYTPVEYVQALRIETPAYKGDILVNLFPDHAPKTVANFMMISSSAFARPMKNVDAAAAAVTVVVSGVVSEYGYDGRGRVAESRAVNGEVSVARIAVEDLKAIKALGLLGVSLFTGGATSPFLLPLIPLLVVLVRHAVEGSPSIARGARSGFSSGGSTSGSNRRTDSVASRVVKAGVINCRPS